MIAGLFVLAGCATPGYNPGRIQSELVRAGASPAQARCVTDNMGDTFDQKELGSHSPPNAITSPSSTSSSAPGSTSTTSTSVAPAGSSATSSTTIPQQIDEYKVTRGILKKCGVTLPVDPLP